MTFEAGLPRITRWAAVLTLALVSAAGAQSPGAMTLRPNLESNIDRPLRYQPDGADFVIVNGTETFNRSLYGRNTAFRVDGGDRPEFVMYLPGRGGNLRIGLRKGAEAKWLVNAAHFSTRYRPGELLYEIRDPMLGVRGVLQIQLLALHETDGLVLRYAYQSGGNPQPSIELIAAFGGVNGQRGVRDGDIGTERVPISQWFQLAPEFCRDNTFALERNTFELRSSVAHIAGVLPRDATLTLGDARNWSDAKALLTPASAAAEPILVARMPLVTGKVSYLALQRVAGAASATELDTYRDVSATPGAAPPPEQFAARYAVDQLPKVFARTREHFRALRDRVSVNTPDPFVDAAVGALNVAADALWDEPQQVLMHGAIAWRARLLGWRGPYVMDALGWHDRARLHLEYWATRQNTLPVPDALPPAEEATHLARNPAALHSNGDISNSHYDMNLVYIDALFRHLLWTGDLKFARAQWPMIERHLTWERRLFRREFGPQRLPLYEAYAAIWASDDLQYHGGGVTHATAYNWWHNVMAARVAKLLGEDAALYEREATAIRQAMTDFLWLPEQGMFAEYRDYLGLQRAHPAAALWSFYHVLDAPGLASPTEALHMSRYVKSQLPRLPVRGPGVPGDNLHLFATSNWMPYTWSINNIVMGENMHAALGFWQAGDPGEGFALFRSAFLASMFMGISPGNVGSMNYLDVYRRESQRDFADGAGVMSRALIEGMFGIRPDALGGIVNIEPGWPDRWNYAVLRAPQVKLNFHREEKLDRYVLELPGHGRSSAFKRARMRLRMQGDSALVSVNRKEVLSLISHDDQGRQWLAFSFPVRKRQEIYVEWVRMSPLAPTPAAEPFPGIKTPLVPTVGTPVEPAALYAPVDLGPYFNDRVSEIFRPGKYLSPRSRFASLAMPSQGIGAWAGHVNATADIDDAGLRRAAAAGGGKITLPSGVPFMTPGMPDAPNIVFTSQWDNYPGSVRIPLEGRARRLHVLVAGSTNHMQSQFDNGEIVVDYQDGTRERLPLHNPTNWWPIEQDYFVDDFQFRRVAPIPPRVDLKTGRVRVLNEDEFKGRGGVVPGGAATVLELPLQRDKELRALTVTALANEVVVGLMSATLVR